MTIDLESRIRRLEDRALINESLTQHAGWSDGNENAVSEATARSRAQKAGPQRA